MEPFSWPHKEHTGSKSINCQKTTYCESRSTAVSWLSDITWGEECTLQSDIIKQGERRDGRRRGVRLSRDSYCRQEVIIKTFLLWVIEDLSEVYYFSSLFIFSNVTWLPSKINLEDYLWLLNAIMLSHREDYLVSDKEFSCWGKIPKTQLLSCTVCTILFQVNYSYRQPEFSLVFPTRYAGHTESLILNSLPCDVISVWVSFTDTWGLTTVS